jgi:DNA-binding Lrp family transcriptional regulator
MIKAYVLIVTQPGATRRVVEALTDVPHISTIHEVMGPYDIVVELEAEALTDVPPILSDRIRTLEGIQSTTSLVAFPGDGTADEPPSDQ